MKKERHHHGQLREALILAGFALMEQGGPEALTLRKCAARAGVSHAAPAHHFRGLISLKAAIVARGFQIFTETMQAHRNGSAPSPRAQLLAICDGYLAFARAHAALFRFMFQDFGDAITQINPWVQEELTLHSATAFGELRQACAPFAPLNGHVQGTEVAVWSLVHGYAMLFSGSSTPETPLGSPPDFAQILPDFPLR